jgi:hypothetical protein
MRRARGGQPRDLLLVAAASLSSLALMALPFGGLVKALLLLPAVLLLPGYALTRAMFPIGRLPGDERLVYTFTLSVAAAALGGLVWQLAFDLNRLTWALVLTAITLASCAIAQRRRKMGGAIQSQERLGPLGSRAESTLPRLDAPTAVAVLAGIAIVITAVAIAADGLRDERAEFHYSALWVVPASASSDDVEIGVWNHQGAVHKYRLTVETGGRTIEEWRGRLGARQNKQLTLAPPAFPAGARLLVSLYRDGALYRRAELAAGGGA